MVVELVVLHQSGDDVDEMVDSMVSVVHDGGNRLVGEPVNPVLLQDVVAPVGLSVH